LPELALLCWLSKLSLVLVDRLAEWWWELIGGLGEVGLLVGSLWEVGLLQAGLVIGRLLYHHHWLRGLLHHHGLLGRLLPLSLALALTLGLRSGEHCHVGEGRLGWLDGLDNSGLLVVSGS
jgi:hypothetical protein